MPIRVLSQRCNCGRRRQGLSRVLQVTEAEQAFTLSIYGKPLPLYCKGFGADQTGFYSRDQLMFLMQHDSDGFNRWEAGQQLSVQVLQELYWPASA
jgi:aminopeptidase N